MSDKSIIEQNQDIAQQVSQELTHQRIEAIALSRDIIIHSAFFGLCC